MKQKNLLFYFIAFALLALVFFLFSNAYKELIHYSALTNRSSHVYMRFQTLSKEIDNAAVINPDLLTSSAFSKGDNLFFTDSQTVIGQLDSLVSAVKDTVNICIAHKLDTMIRTELSWMLRSNVPDSMIRHRSAAHIAALQDINLLIRQGLDRTSFLLATHKEALHKAIDKVIIWMIIFILLAATLIGYTTVTLFHQRSKTEIKEEQLKKTEKLLVHTLDNMLEGAQIHDHDWRYTYVNDALVRYSTYTREELIGYTLMDKYPGIENTELFGTLTRAKEDRIARHLETEFVFPNGTKAFFELSIQPVPEGIFILSVDITERKIAQEALQKSEFHYRMLIEQAADGIFVANAHGHYTDVNIAACAMLGYTYEEMITLQIGDLIAAEETPRISDEVTKLRSGKIVTSEWSFKRKDGSLFPGEWIGRILPDGSIQAIVRDITEQKKAREHLLKANRLYAFISAINQTIVHTKNEKDLFEKACEIAVKIGGFHLGWIGMLNDNGHLNVVKTTGNENAARAIQKLSGSDYYDPMLRHTFIGRMLWTGRYVVVNNVQVEPSMILWRKDMLDMGVKSAIALPIKKFGKTVGVFCLNSETEEIFDKDEIALLEEAANDISFALEVFDNDNARVLAEQQLQKANRLYTFLSSINQSIVHVRDEEELLDKVCAIAIEIGLFKIAWVGRLNNTGKLDIIKICGDEAAAKELAKYSGLDYRQPELRETATGRALSTGVYAVSNAVQNDPAMRSWKEEHERHDIKANISLPLKKFGNVIGIFGLNSTTEHFFDTGEINLLEEAAGDISFALEIFDKEKMRRLAGEHLMRNEAKLKDAQALARIGSWEIDLVHNSIFWSDEYYVLLGYKPGEVVPSDELFLSMVHADDVVSVSEKFKRTFQILESSFANFRIVRRDGNIMHVYCEWKFEFDRTQNPVRIYGITQDVTESKKAEEEIKNLNETLEQRIIDRTTELTEANKALEAFSYSVSHDLRAPVRAMIGFARIIQDEYGQAFNPDLQEMFDHIIQSSKRMNAIIDDMLTLAKYDSEKLQPATVDIGMVFQTVWDNISFAQPHHATLKLAALPAVMADSSMIQQVIINLMSNAIKYSSRKEKPVIEVGCEQTDTSITYFIKDNGVGFDMKNYNRLFGAFQRLHGSTEFEGTGVGLMLVKKIIERHGGEVWAEGKVGEGATFYFALPYIAS
ncbi:MAG: hypothetical protein JWO03_3832 [Bacteroidetes bacterium]|nr:hypothetical protein [Bacteroidota bacterium]